jgi:transcriptional regulator with XRE-family HTH domain
MTGPARASGKRLSRTERLTEQFKNEKFRKHYFARQLKIFLAAQIRALRGNRTQAQFGDLIGKPQSVVARLERESYGKVNLQTLIDIATKLDIALVIRFVTFPTFLEWTKDYSAQALAPESYPARIAAKPGLENALRGQGLRSNSDVHPRPLENATKEVTQKVDLDDARHLLRGMSPPRPPPSLRELSCV